MNEMSRVAKTGWKLAAFATLVYVALMPVTGRTESRHGQIVSRPTFEAHTLVAALPAVLTSPAVQSSWHLISMVANDIDADGDLDVVANDGSLELLVWINDGTGRLTRRQNRPASTLRPDASGPGFAGEPAGSDAAIHGLLSFLQPQSSIASALAERSRPRSDGTTHPLQPAFVSSRTPRAPPAAVFLS
jgi:hypothetical protein